MFLINAYTFNGQDLDKCKYSPYLHKPYFCHRLEKDDVGSVVVSNHADRLFIDQHGVVYGPKRTQACIIPQRAMQKTVNGRDMVLGVPVRGITNTYNEYLKKVFVGLGDRADEVFDNVIEGDADHDININIVEMTGCRPIDLVEHLGLPTRRYAGWAKGNFCDVWFDVSEDGVLHNVWVAYEYTPHVASGGVDGFFAGWFPLRMRSCNARQKEMHPVYEQACYLLAFNKGDTTPSDKVVEVTFDDFRRILSRWGYRYLEGYDVEGEIKYLNSNLHLDDYRGKMVII